MGTLPSAGSTPSSPSAGGLVLGKAWKCPSCPRGHPCPARCVSLTGASPGHQGGLVGDPALTSLPLRPPSPSLKALDHTPTVLPGVDPASVGPWPQAGMVAAPSLGPRLNQWHLWQRGGNSLGSSHTPGAPSVAGGASRGPAPITPPVPPRVLRAPGGGRGRGAGGRVWRRKKVLPWRCTWGACCSTESREGRGLRARCGQHPSPRHLRSAGTQADSTESTLAAPTHVRVRGPDSGGGARTNLQAPRVKGRGNEEEAECPRRGSGVPMGNRGSQHPKQPSPQGGLGPGREQGAGLPSGCRSARGAIRHTRVCTRTYVHSHTQAGGNPRSGLHALQAPLNPRPSTAQLFPEQPASMGPGAWRQAEASPVTSPALPQVLRPALCPDLQDAPAHLRLLPSGPGSSPRRSSPAWPGPASVPHLPQRVASNCGSPATPEGTDAPSALSPQPPGHLPPAPHTRGPRRPLALGAEGCTFCMNTDFRWHGLWGVWGDVALRGDLTPWRTLQRPWGQQGLEHEGFDSLPSPTAHARLRGVRDAFVSPSTFAPRTMDAGAQAGDAQEARERRPLAPPGSGRWDQRGRPDLWCLHGERVPFL